jgi:hypothetical protein
MGSIDVEWDEKRLSDATGVLDYELRMLAQLPAEVARLDREGHVTLKNACLESFLVHARNLIDFLCDRSVQEKQTRPTDIVAGLFLAAPITFFPRDRFVDWSRSISRLVLHLTDTAAEPLGVPQYFVTDAAHGIILEMNAFASRLIDEGSPYGRTIKASAERASSDFAMCQERWPDR